MLNIFPLLALATLGALAVTSLVELARRGGRGRPGRVSTACLGAFLLAASLATLALAESADQGWPPIMALLVLVRFAASFSLQRPLSVMGSFRRATCGTVVTAVAWMAPDGMVNHTVLIGGALFAYWTLSEVGGELWFSQVGGVTGCCALGSTSGMLPSSSASLQRPSCSPRRRPHRSFGPPRGRRSVASPWGT